MVAVALEIAVERDARAMNRMDPETKHVHLLLEEWAKWSRDRGIAGYPRQSPTWKAALYGRLGIPQEPLYRPEPQMPDHIAAVDEAVAKLGDIDRRVVIEYYMQWLPIEVNARRCRMSVRHFQAVLRRARWRIRGYLDAKDIRI